MSDVVIRELFVEITKRDALKHVVELSEELNAFVNDINILSCKLTEVNADGIYPDKKIVIVECHSELMNVVFDVIYTETQHGNIVKVYKQYNRSVKSFLKDIIPSGVQESEILVVTDVFREVSTAVASGNA